VVDGGVLAMVAEPFRFDIEELWRVKRRGAGLGAGKKST